MNSKTKTKARIDWSAVVGFYDRPADDLATEIGCTIAAVYNARQAGKRRARRVLRTLPGVEALPNGDYRVDSKLQPALYDAALSEEIDTVLQHMLNTGEIKLAGKGKDGEQLYEYVKPAAPAAAATAAKRIKWRDIDLDRPAAIIARELGCSRASVHAARNYRKRSTSQAKTET